MLRQYNCAACQVNDMFLLNPVAKIEVPNSSQDGTKRSSQGSKGKDGKRTPAAGSSATEPPTPDPSTAGAAAAAAGPVAAAKDTHWEVFDLRVPGQQSAYWERLAGAFQERVIKGKAQVHPSDALLRCFPYSEAVELKRRSAFLFERMVPVAAWIRFSRALEAATDPVDLKAAKQMAVEFGLPNSLVGGERSGARSRLFLLPNGTCSPHTDTARDSKQLQSFTQVVAVIATVVPAENDYT